MPQDFHQFWANKKVFLTGHTGFKGSWLSLYLSSMGAEVYGYSLEPPTTPNLFTLADVCSILADSTIEDINNFEALSKAINNAQPEILIHMAAQPLVRDSYKIPIETYQTNVMGVVHILEASRACDSIRAIINVTTDKVYENKEWHWPYRENDRLGGYDPYSNSKACSELVTASYISSFMNPKDYSLHKKAIASARAGNVIGGGDFATDRLVPDIIRAFMHNKKITIRSPKAIRPWQHVLEPLTGYLYLAQTLYEKGANFNGSYNFGPEPSGFQPVLQIVQTMIKLWGGDIELHTEPEPLHEASILKLDCAKSNELLNWQPRMKLSDTLISIIDFTKAYIEKQPVQKVCLEQIAAYKNIKSNL